jgi:hypothetical protein
VEKEYHNTKNNYGELMAEVQANIMVDGNNIPVTNMPIEIQVFTEVPQTAIEIFCNEKKYNVKLNNNLRLQMTA